MKDFYKSEVREIDDLIPYASNSRTHSDDQVAQIAASIKEFGVTSPILVDENNGIIAGHGRLAAMKKLKMKETPVIILEGLTEAQRKAYVIADNKLTLNGGWDDEILAIEFEALKDMDFDLELTGFSLEEIDDMFLNDVDEIEMPNLSDEEPEYQQKTFTLHNEQCPIIEDALKEAKQDPLVDTGLNDNSNGNALTLICEQWLQQKTS